MIRLPLWYRTREIKPSLPGKEHLLEPALNLERYAWSEADLRLKAAQLDQLAGVNHLARIDHLACINHLARIDHFACINHLACIDHLARVDHSIGGQKLGRRSRVAGLGAGGGGLCSRALADERLLRDCQYRVLELRD
jgi:hypothetical protein